MNIEDAQKQIDKFHEKIEKRTQIMKKEKQFIADITKVNRVTKVYLENMKKVQEIFSLINGQDITEISVVPAFERYYARKISTS